VRSVLDQFFNRPVIRTAMSEHLQGQLPRGGGDKIAVDSMVESIKDFFTGAMASKGRRTDLNMNVFYAAAAAIIPKNVRENRQMRAVMRLTGLRYDAVSKALKLRAELEDSANGWRLLTTAKHADRVDWTAVDRYIHSDSASTPDNDTKRQVRVGMEEEGGVISYMLHNQRYWNDQIPVVHRNFLETKECKDMQRKFEGMEKEKRRAKALKRAKYTAAKRTKGGQEPSRAEVKEAKPTVEEVDAEHSPLTDEYRKRAAKTRARWKLRNDGREPTEGEVGAELSLVHDYPQLDVSLTQFRKRL
jgi:hypothetical protein